MIPPVLFPSETSVDALPTGASLTMVAQWYAGLARRVALEFILGSMPGKLPGKGLDFRDLREYQFGDDLRHLDWRASARTGKWLTRQFQQEHGFNLTLVVDTSASMAFGSRAVSKQQTAALLASFLAWIGSYLGCKMSLFTLDTTLKPRILHSKSATFPTLASGDILYTQCTGTANWQAAWDFFQSQKHSRGLVFFLSDFWAPLDKEKVSRLGPKVRPCFLRILDQAELSIPANLEVLISDPETGLDQELILNSNDAIKYRQSIEQHGLAFEETLTMAGLPQITLVAGNMVLRQFIHFLSQQTILRKGVS